jgi:GYF domain 2/Protein of unknown function (DUF3039)
MSWFYVDAGLQNGPVSDSQLDELLRSGKISPTTMVWREGMSNWQPLNIGRAAGQPGLICAVCGKAFPPEEVVRINNSPVCAQCKPIFLQRLAEGVLTPSIGNLWRRNKRLVTRSETIFPDRCVRCNAPAGSFRLKRTLYWVYPAYLLTIFLSPLILIIVYMIVRKKAVVHIGLCEAHRVQRTAGLAIGWGSFAVAVFLWCCAGVFGSGWWVVSGLFVVLMGGLAGSVMARTVAVTKIDKGYVWVSGVHRDFLAQLPDWSGP